MRKFTRSFFIAAWIFLYIGIEAHALAQSKTMPVIEALNKVSKKYDVRFVYEKKALAGLKTSNDFEKARNKGVEEVLKNILYPEGLLFLYVKKNYYAVVPDSRQSLPGSRDVADARPAANRPLAGRYFAGASDTTTPGMIKRSGNRFLRGKVIDSLGNPIAGVSVRVAGTNKGVVTRADGSYEVEAQMPATLEFSSIGYITKRVQAGFGNQVGEVVLHENKTGLKEVIVRANTGYQTISKERATGAFDVIGQSQLDKPATSIAQRLIGTVAGMQARSRDVNGDPTFEIRGQTSLYADAQPLVVVDGFAVEGDFNSINPNDVASITVLKDAAAASIWGARAANGVIVVTTKSARHGSPLKVEFSAFTRVGKKVDLGYVNPLASSAETVEYEKLAFNHWTPLINSGSLTSNYYYAWSQASTAMSENYLGYLPDNDMNAILDKLKTQDNRGQISKYLLSNPVNQQYNLTLSGSTGEMNNTLSILYQNDQSNFKETHDKKYMINYKTSADVFRWLTVNLSAMLQYNKAHNNGVSLGDIQNLSPYDMLLNPDGSYTNINQYYWPILERFVPMDQFPYPWTYNPLQEIRNRDLTTTQLNTRLQAGLRFKLIEGLTFDSKIQYESFNTFNRNLYNDNTFYVRDMVNTASTWDEATNDVTLNLPKGDILNQSRSKAEAYNFRNQVNFNRLFGEKHEINFIAGTEVSNLVTQGFSYPRSYGYNDETLTLGTFPNGPGGTFYPIKNWLGRNETFGYTNSFSYRTERYFSYYANAAYTYNSKYTVSGSYRADASNMITDDPKYRYAPFWSVGLAWQIYKESFMHEISWLDWLNLRVTYGYNGNVDRSTAFRPLIDTKPTPNVYTNDFTASISSYGNPTLRWEKTGTLNIGIDYALFHGRLFGKLDVYNKSGKDLIADISIPAVNGTTSQKLNTAEMTNRGIELEAGTNIRIKGDDIVWHGKLNFSYNKNKITKLFVANYAAYDLYGGGTAAYTEGKDANTLWRFQYAGVENNQPMVKGAGDDKYDFTGWTPGDGRDYLLDMGTTVAPYTLGMINSFTLYDFDVSFIITGQLGHVFDRMSFNYPVQWTTRILPNKRLSEVLNGDPQKIVPLPLNPDEPRFYFWDRFYPYLSYLVQSASNIRLQEVNVTYNLKTAFLNRMHISDFRLYLQGNDLLTVLANSYGEDPVYPMGTMKPQPKFTFGLRLEL